MLPERVVGCDERKLARPVAANKWSQPSPIWTSTTPVGKSPIGCVLSLPMGVVSRAISDTRPMLCRWRQP